MTRLEYALVALAILLIAINLSGCAPARFVTYCITSPASCN